MDVTTYDYTPLVGAILIALSIAGVVYAHITTNRKR
jgi:hypothetical protein